jgi:hypothetical protein
LHHALRAARAGRPIFRLRPYRPDYADPDAAKTPVVGPQERTTDEARIRRWFAAAPDLNWALPADGLLIVDVDPDKGGFESLRTLELPRDTYTVQTPRGGLHLYYKLPPGVRIRNSRGKIGPGIDIRTDGGYVVGPGSVVRGKPYVVLQDIPIIQAPQHLIDRCSKRPEKIADARTPFTALDAPPALAWAEAYVASLQPAEQGARNNTLHRHACTLKDAGISEAACRELLHLQWAVFCDPPLEPEEVEKTVRSAFENGERPPGIEAPHVEFEDLSADPAVRSLLERVARPESKAPAPFRPLDLLRDPETLPPRPWLFYGDVLRGVVTGLVAPPGAGKSALSIAMAIAASRGDGGFLGLKVVGGRQRTLIINNEDDETEQTRRIFAACALHGIDRRSLQDDLHAYVGARRLLAVARHSKTQRLERTKALEAVAAYIVANRISLVFVDPFAEMHEGAENSNEDMAAVMAFFRELARATNAAIVVVHHSKKPADAKSDGYAGDPNSARGASAFHGNVRGMLTLYPAGKEDAALYGWTPAEARKRVRLDTGKASYQARPDEARWFELVSVPSGNLDILGKPETAVALRPINAAAQAERRRLDYHEKLQAHLLEAAEAGLKLKAAARYLKADPLLNTLSLETIAGHLKDCFEDNPCTHQGVTIWYDGKVMRGELAL